MTTEAKSFGKLFLIPTPLEGQDLTLALPQSVIEITRGLEHFIVENAKTARGFLKKIETKTAIQQLKLEELNEHTSESQIEALLSPLKQGISCGLISETGAPCLADPGASLVAKAHKLGITVVPLVGPSSILLAIMSSGLNGQNFSFCGYLPSRAPEQRIQELEKHSATINQSQFFMETPYRAQKLFQSILSTCKLNTKLSVGINLGSDSANCMMKTIGEWKSQQLDLDDKLVVFGIQG